MGDHPPPHIHIKHNSGINIKFKINECCLYDNKQRLPKNFKLHPILNFISNNKENLLLYWEQYQTIN